MSETREVLILTGTCSVGKTSTAKAWAKSKNGTVIECDNLKELNYKEDFPSRTEEEEKLISNLAANKAFEYLQKGESVAIDNVWSPKAIEEIRAELFRMKDLEVTSVRLICDLEENQKRDQEKMPENQKRERITIVNDELNSHAWPSYIKDIDNTNLSKDEVLKLIEEE
jgi:broad-specificity NMP kinase